MAAKKKAKQVGKEKVVEITATFYVNDDDISELGDLISNLEDMIRNSGFDSNKGIIKVTGLLDKE